MSRRALLLGATGLVGGHCLRLLLDCDAYQEVRVLTRRSLGINHPKLIEKVVEPAQFEKEAEFFQVDDVFCALGTTLKQAGSKEAFREVDLGLITAVGRVARDAGVQRFMMVSAVNANAHSPFFYARTKGQAERELKALKLPLLALFQPSLLLGERERPRPVEAFGIRFSKIIDPITRWTDAHWLPVSGERVAEALVGMALEGPATGVYRVRFRDFVVYAGKFREKYPQVAS